MTAKVQVPTIAPVGYSNLEGSCADASPLCLRSTVTTSIGIKFVGPVTVFTLGLAMVNTGAWIEPLGLTHFAMVDGSMDFKLQLSVQPPSGVVPLVMKIFWSASLFFKRSGDWPVSMFSTDTATYTGPRTCAKAIVKLGLWISTATEAGTLNSA